MHSEIAITFKTGIDFPRLIATMGELPVLEEIREQTVFKGDPNILGNVVYGQIQADCVYLIFRDSATSCRVHVENRIGRGDLPNLRHKSEQIASRLVKDAAELKNKVAYAEIGLYVGDCLIAFGSRLRKLDKIKASLREKAAPDFFKGLSTGILTLIFTRKVPESAVAGAGAFVVLMIWLIISSFQPESEYEYTTV